MLDEMFNDSMSQAGKQANSQSLIRLCERALDFDKKVKEYELRVEECKKLLKEVVEIHIPAEMAALGLGDSTTTAAGHKINLKQKVFASVNDSNREIVTAWLRANGYGDIIKNQVIANFAKENDADAQRVVAWLNSEVEGVLSIDQKESVHSATLQSLLKERLEQGKGLPIDEIGCYVATQAVVKLTN